MRTTSASGKNSYGPRWTYLSENAFALSNASGSLSSRRIYASPAFPAGPIRIMACISHGIAWNDSDWSSSLRASSGTACLSSSTVLSGATSTLSRPAVPQSHRAAKKTFRKSGLAVRSSLNPASGLRAASSGSASAMSARISLSEG